MRTYANIKGGTRRRFCKKKETFQMSFRFRARARLFQFLHSFSFFVVCSNFHFLWHFVLCKICKFLSCPNPNRTHTYLSCHLPLPNGILARSWQALPAIPFKSAFLRLDCIIKVNNWLATATARVLRVKNITVFKIFQTIFNLANFDLNSLSYPRGFSADLLICCGLLTRGSTTVPGISFLGLTT